MPARWSPAIAITGSRLLRTELRTVEQQAGYDLEYADTVPAGRRFARHRPLIIIGTDLLARVRRPLTCRGLVIVASVHSADKRIWPHAIRVGATWCVTLPTGGLWLAHHLVRDLPPVTPDRPPAHRSATD